MLHATPLLLRAATGNPWSSAHIRCDAEAGKVLASLREGLG
jgi:hypothetical protein